MLERLVYVSRATPGLGAREVYDIVRTAHNRNGLYGLTGGLVFLDGWFVQVLEGDGFRLRERFERIRVDPRHTALDVRAHGPVAERTFTDDWMALRQHADLDPAALQRLQWRPGLPGADAARTLAFVHACCGLIQPA